MWQAFDCDVAHVASCAAAVEGAVAGCDPSTLTRHHLPLVNLVLCPFGMTGMCPFATGTNSRIWKHQFAPVRVYRVVRAQSDGLRCGRTCALRRTNRRSLSCSSSMRLGCRQRRSVPSQPALRGTCRPVAVWNQRCCCALLQSAAPLQTSVQFRYNDASTPPPPHPPPALQRTTPTHVYAPLNTLAQRQ